MTRTTLDYGIDLGTTNSAIAVLNDTSTEIIRNNDGEEVTPSVVMIDKKERLLVGQAAYDRKLQDPDNVHSEFKLQMGTDHRLAFERTGQQMTPEELSAEVLKELKAAVRQKKGEDLTAAVISVPAAFELPQCEATRRAAELAGIGQSPLVQEPVAAAMAYGFQNESDRVFWLVYDLGGGTFDAALVQVRDEIIQVVNHSGDNHLGGKLLDWAIVDELLVPAVQRQLGVTDFRRGDPKWQGAVSKLKYDAEEAKIRLSRYETITIERENLFQAQDGSPVHFEYELRRADVERLFAPLVDRSIEICRRVLTEKQLGAGDLEKVILVGGPTLSPYLRQRLEDPHQGLGIPLEFSLDPMTVVARGAAIFSGTQRMDPDRSRVHAPETCFLDLTYKPVGSDPEPMVGGRVVAEGIRNFTGYTLEFTNQGAQPTWRSGKVSVSANGAFTTRLWAERGQRNTYIIQLWDPQGSELPVSPDQLTYTVGRVITEPPLIHSIGIALANNEVSWLFQKGAALPVKKLEVLRSTVPLRSGQSGGLLRVPIVEGENPRADRNALIGSIEVHSDGIPRDYPAGAEVEVKVEITESRLLQGEAYLPLLNLGAEVRTELVKEAGDPGQLSTAFGRERERLAKARQRARQLDNPGAQEELARIDRQGMEAEVEHSLDAAAVDPDALDKAERRLRELQTALDQAEASLELPTWLAEAEKQLAETRELIREHGKPEDMQALERLERQLQQARDAGDGERLDRLTGEIRALGLQVLAQHPGFWVAMLDQLETMQDRMQDRSSARALFAQAYRARDRGDLGGLQAAVRQLLGLLPVEEQQRVDGFGSTVMR